MKTNLERFALLIVASLLIVAIASAQGTLLQVDIDPSVPAVINKRLVLLLTRAAGSRYNVVAGPTDPKTIPAGSIIITFGPTEAAKLIIRQSEVDALAPEGYIARHRQVALTKGKVDVFAADGRPPNQKVTDVFPPDVSLPNTGLHYACYALLEELGFAFLHPLDPVVPSLFLTGTTFNIKAEPKWPIRGWHYHTEHPLELTNFLNGWGLKTHDDRAGWESMMPEWHLFLEWLIANRQNCLEYLLLASDDWREFVESPVRQDRFVQINKAALEWGIAIAADVPIAIRQQHAWYMTDGFGSLERQVKQIEDRIDWLMKAGFHFLSTESGFSEFTHPECSTMVAWMNATADYTRNKYNRRTFIKVHISHGQMCPEYADPTTGVPPCNFNYLPHYATKNMGALPHTVQMYTFDDPAPTYGQKDFHNMFEFMMNEAPHRYTLYHGETAYWVNYDIDVPLFLPYYARGRLYDLRKTARAEVAQNRRIMGQFNFESGWEWAYWFQNTITARAAYDPKPATISDAQALYESVHDITRAFGLAAKPLAEWLVRYMALQRNLLVLGNWNGTAPSDVVRKNGMAYLEGWDTWAQLMPIVGMATQPLSLDIMMMSTGMGQDFYAHSVRGLLQAMATQFTTAYNDLYIIQPIVAPSAKLMFADILDSTLITAKRAHFIFAIYDSLWHEKPLSWRKARLDDARTNLTQAVRIVGLREQQYRVPVERVAGWGRNTTPTCYEYQHLWTVHSLFYWFRDLFRASNTLTAIDPCFMNVIDPARVAFGDKTIGELEKWLADYLRRNGLASLAACLDPPRQEPVYTIPDPFSTA